VVLRVSQERTGVREIRFNVQLAAVGSTSQLAAAIRLVGFNASEIESVKTEDSLSFNRTNGKDFPDQMKTVIPKNKTSFYESFLSSGLNGEAVINLFGDAHWATGDLLEENFGMMTRKKYNVKKSASNDYPQFVPRSITYIVTFKSSDGLNDLSMNKIDPFIMEMYNGSVFEVHQYIYQDAQVLYNYSSSKIKNLPWALCIPKGDFRWPVEGQNMGFIMKEVHTYGAYQTSGHSFGEWAMDHTKTLDWYNYPQEKLVF
jgi:LruC domain-containing protein